MIIFDEILMSFRLDENSQLSFRRASAARQEEPAFPDTDDAHSNHPPERQRRERTQPTAHAVGQLKRKNQVPQGRQKAIQRAG
jgi:hypothetical protein